MGPSFVLNFFTILQKPLHWLMVTSVCRRNKADFVWFWWCPHQHPKVGGRGSELWRAGGKTRTTPNKWPQHRIIEEGQAGTGCTFYAEVGCFPEEVDKRLSPQCVFTPLFLVWLFKLQRSVKYFSAFNLSQRRSVHLIRPTWLWDIWIYWAKHWCSCSPIPSLTSKRMYCVFLGSFPALLFTRWHSFSTTARGGGVVGADCSCLGVKVGWHSPLDSLRCQLYKGGLPEVKPESIKSLSIRTCSFFVCCETTLPSVTSPILTFELFHWFPLMCLCQHFTNRLRQRHKGGKENRLFHCTG